MEGVAPRVNSARLSQFIGRDIRVPCKIIKVQGSTALVESTDAGQITVRVMQTHEYTQGAFVEFIAKGIDSNTVQMYQMGAIAPDTDLKLIDTLIELTFKHPSIYHP